VESEDDRRLHEALLRRAEEAVIAAEQIVATSLVMTSISTDLREGSLTSRCAWCGRYRVGEDRWVRVGPNVVVDMADTTHGICEDCVDALRAAGLTR
jgi:hypothetical protein